MSPPQQRVMDEKRDLDAMRGRLAAFNTGAVFASLDAAEQERLVRQASCMGEYSEILGERIAAFKEPK